MNALGGITIPDPPVPWASENSSTTVSAAVETVGKTEEGKKKKSSVLWLPGDDDEDLL